MIARPPSFCLPPRLRDRHGRTANRGNPTRRRLPRQTLQPHGMGWRWGGLWGGLGVDWAWIVGGLGVDWGWIGWRWGGFCYV